MNRTRDFYDGFSGIGTVTIRPFKILPGGKRHYLPFTKNNLIVEMGRATLIDLMVGAARRKLSYIRWGNGGALQFPDGDPLNPLPVEDKDTDVKSFLLDKPLSPYTRVSPTIVEYTETLICDEVDNDVNEAVMLFEDQDSQERTIFARITFPTVRLTIEQGTGIEIRWQFNFSKAEEQPIPHEDQPIEVVPEPGEGTPPADGEVDITAPAAVANLESSVNDQTVTLTWDNPLDEDFSHVFIDRDGVQLANRVTEETFTDTLTIRGIFTYNVYAVDLEGNVSSGTSVTVTI